MAKKIMIDLKHGAFRKWKPELYSESRSPFDSWDDFVAFNAQQECSNPACTKKRYARAKYCEVCSRYCTMLGDPRYRPLRLRQYRPYVVMAKDLIDFNMDNIIVTDFIDKFTSIAYQGNKGMNIEWASWWAYIHTGLNRENKTWRNHPEKLLAQFCGLYAFYEMTGCEYIKSERMWHYSLAMVGLRAVKQKVRPLASPTRARKFGKYLWDVFGIYLIKIGRGLLKIENRKKVNKQRLQEAEIELPEMKGEEEQC